MIKKVITQNKQIDYIVVYFNQQKTQMNFIDKIAVHTNI